MQRAGMLPVIPFWLVWLVALSFVLVGLGSFGILDNNEGLYAEISREMLASHDWRQWVIPYLNGLPYLEKPPLLYWLTALSFAVFGESEWSARLVPTLSGLACVAGMLWFGSTVKRPQAARLAAIMFVSGTGVTAMSHVLMFDMLLCALLTAALACGYRYLLEDKRRFLRLASAFLGFAVMAKGVVALTLFGLVVIIFMLGTARSMRDFGRACGKWLDRWAILIFVAIAIPWHVAASISEPIFAWFYFINEHVLRFLGKREPHDYYAGPWWYYLPRMAIYLFPWSFLLPCLFKTATKVANNAANDRIERDRIKLSRFLWSVWLVPLIFFSISNAKANYYLIAVMPFAAFHLAIAIEDRHFLTGVTSAVPGLLIAALAAALYVTLMSHDQMQHALMIWGLPQRQFALGVTGGMLVLALACGVAAWRRPRLGMLAYLALALWTSIALLAAVKALEPTISTREIAQTMQNELRGRTVYLYRNFEERSSLPFYLKTPVAVIDTRSNDLLWGSKLRENDILISIAQFSHRLDHQRVAVVVIDRQLSDFRANAFFTRFKEEKRIGETTLFFN
jgi:4-amino-4-deoxy-L-arabinose transferase-like glycosyltransferase